MPLPQRMTVEEWNDVWFPRVQPLRHAPAHLMIYQVMKGQVLFEDVLYDIVAWAPPKGKAYVEATRVPQGETEHGRRNRDDKR